MHRDLDLDPDKYRHTLMLIKELTKKITCTTPEINTKVLPQKDGHFRILQTAKNNGGDVKSLSDFDEKETPITIRIFDGCRIIHNRYKDGLLVRTTGSCAGVVRYREEYRENKYIGTTGYIDHVGIRLCTVTYTDEGFECTFFDSKGSSIFRLIKEREGLSASSEYEDRNVYYKVDGGKLLGMDVFQKIKEEDLENHDFTHDHLIYRLSFEYDLLYSLIEWNVEKKKYVETWSKY